MRRADWLFQIVQHLRARRLTTARQLGAWLQVSHRTIYRDIQDLSLSGVPVEGEAGVGYRLSRGFDMPPIMFAFDEVEALVVGLRMMETWGGPALATASRSPLSKVTLALPEARREEAARAHLFAPDFHLRPEVGDTLERVRRAIGVSARSVQPLGLYNWGATWTLAAWCESRAAFRNFRVDRMSAVELDSEFPAAPEKSLEVFLLAMRRQP